VLDDPRFREKLAAVEVELKALELTQLRVVADERRAGGDRGRPNPASSILKLKGSEIQQKTTELLMDVVGPYALPYQRDADGRNEPLIGPEGAAEAAPNYFNYRKVSIYGGSNEIQRSIVTKAILGL
jgi:alkylation response protein AidB-like acyl-CoA dehydrogenase